MSTVNIGLFQVSVLSELTALLSS